MDQSDCEGLVCNFQFMFELQYMCTLEMTDILSTV